MTNTRVRLLALLAAALPLASACALNPFSSGSDARDELREARLRWERNRPGAYFYTVTRQCFCADVGPMRVMVVNGTVVSRVYATNGQPVPADRLADLDTVEELFELLEDALDQGPAKFDASYHSRLGYPVSAFIDRSARVIDEEDGFTVTDFGTPER